MAEQKEFEEIFNHIGGMGLYQVALFLLSCAAAIISSDLYYINFVGRDMPHWCHVPQLSIFPFDVQKHVALPIVEGEYSQCEYYNLNYSSYTEDEFFSWNRTANLPENTLTSKCQSWVYDQSEIASSIVSQYDLVCGDGWKVAFASTMSLFGVLLGVMPLSIAADRFGRQKTAVLTLVVKVLAGFGCAFSPNYIVFAIFSCILGAFSMAFYTAFYVLFLEFVCSKYRGLFGLLLTSSGNLGFMMLAGIGYAVRDATKIQIVMAAPQIILLTFIWVLPESPRWLLLQKKFGKAEKLITYIARVNGRELPADFQIRDYESHEEQARGNPMGILRSPILRKQTVILCLHWFTDSLLFWSLSLNIGSLGSNIYITTVLMASMDVVANWCGGFLVGWPVLGRKYTSCLTLMVAGLACLTCVPLILTDAPLDAITALSLIGKAGATTGFSAIFIYTSEIMPTDVRYAGLGLCSVVSRVSGMVAPFIGGPLRDVWEPLPSLIFGICGIVSGAAILFLPETLNRPLYDTVAHLEKCECATPDPTLSRRELDKGLGECICVNSVDENLKSHDCSCHASRVMRQHDNEGYEKDPEYTSHKLTDEVMLTRL